MGVVQQPLMIMCHNYHNLDGVMQQPLMIMCHHYHNLDGCHATTPDDYVS